MLKAIGKYIDTMPIHHLLSQEEARADTVTIEVDRYHDGLDLSGFLFLMRGVTPSGGETESFLLKEVHEDTITLTWEIGAKFTQEAGKLELDLVAYQYAEEADPEVDAPDHLLRFQLPPINVRGLPTAEHILDERSYTNFLLTVREMEKHVEEIYTAITAEDSELRAEVKRLRSELDALDDLIRTEMQTMLADHENRIGTMEKNWVKIVILTEAEYEALTEKEEKTLYVVKDAAA